MQFLKFNKNNYLLNFLLLAIAIVILQGNRYHKVAKQIANPDYLQQEKELRTALNLRKLLPTFGFDNLVADSLYLEFVQYFGDNSARKATGYSLVPEYFTAIANRDPQFVEAYLTLTTANSMYAGQADTTVKIMEQILESDVEVRDNFYLLWTLKGIDETIFLGDIATAYYSYQQAATIVSQKDTLEADKIADLNQQKAEFLATKPDPTEAQIIAWKSVLPYIVKESEKAVIRDRIKSLEAKLNSQ